MSGPNDALQKLVFELSKLPGIGEKTATRLAFFILKQDASYARSLAEALLGARAQTRLCDRCLQFTDTDRCAICQDFSRDQSLFCVVERPAEVASIERAGVFRGVFHVLHGALSPLDGIGPDELKIRELLARVQSETPREIILATNPSVEGDATALYLARLLKPSGIKVSRLAHGIPVGGLLEYTDRQTLSRAMENRVECL